MQFIIADYAIFTDFTETKSPKSLPKSLLFPKIVYYLNEDLVLMLCHNGTEQMESPQ